MYYFKIVLVFVLLMFSCQRKNSKETTNLVEVNYQDLQRKPQNGFMLYKGTLFTGVAKLFLDNSKNLKYIVTYQNGIKNGVSKRWYDNGNINYETQYVNGRKQGLTKVWYKNGQLQSEATYFKGVIHGKKVTWYATGEKQKERKLRYGQEHGLQKAWRKTGKLYANYEAVNGRIFGLLGSNMCYKLEDEKVKK